MPRAIWRGAISFGLVNVPVRMYSAVGERRLHFHYVHERDGSPIGYEKICKAESRPVPDDEIVKAFEFEPGGWVYMQDEDFETARADGGRTIEITDFVPREEIDPVYFERTYYLGPELPWPRGRRGAGVRAPRAGPRADRANRDRDVRHARPRVPGSPAREGRRRRPRADAFRRRGAPAGRGRARRREGGRPRARDGRRARRTALRAFDPTKYEDTYRERLCEIIRARREGGRVPVAEVEEPEEPEDLLAALRRSVEEARRGRPAKRNGGDGRLERLSKEELLERARELDVPGRSRMSKDELVRAVRER